MKTCRARTKDHERPAASIDTGAGTVATEPPWAGYGLKVAARWPGAEDGLFMGAGVPGARREIRPSAL